MPQDFVFPSCDVKTIWNLWYYGHAAQEIQPYRNLKGHESDLKTKMEKTYLYRAGIVMARLEAIILERGSLPEGIHDIGALDPLRSDEAFAK